MKKQNRLPNVDENSEYRHMYYGAANNALAHIPQKKERYSLDVITNTLTYIYGKLTVEINNGKTLPDTAQNLLDFMNIKISEVNEWKEKPQSTLIKIPFNDYAEYRGCIEKKQKYRLRKQIDEDLEIILNLKMTWKDEKLGIKNLRGNIISSYLPREVDSKNITINFTPEYVFYTTNNYVTLFNTKLGKLDGRNPNIRKIGRRLQQHYFTASNREKGTYDRLRLTTLLKAAPDLPTLDEIKNTDRAYKRRIIEKVEHCLNELIKRDILQEWTWWKSRNTPLTNEELANPTYELLSGCLVHFIFKHDPFLEANN